jgi:uncharacterized repeat protein (TIGR01451 family)
VIASRVIYLAARPGALAAVVSKAFAGRALYLLVAILALVVGGPAHAQAVYTYVNGTDGTISNATPCNNPLVRNFTVSDSFTVQDVDLGVYITHTWRGDNRITLQSPAGTRVQLVNGDSASTSGDNFNVLLDDSGTQVVNTDSPTSNHSTTNPPPFQHNFIPNNALSAFNGESSNGTWRLEICDIYTSADNGTFRHAELYLTSLPSNYADLSLTKGVSNSNPISGESINFTLTLSNSGSSPNTATDVEVTDLIPAGFDVTGYSGYGTYDAITGIWTVASINPGQSRVLVITVTVTASSGASMTNSAEVTSSSHADLDSTPGNGSTTEDDDASVGVTVSGARVAGTPPILSCPNGTLLFDWDTRSWTGGSTNNNYTLTGLGSINFSVTNPGAWLTTFGGANPRLSNTLTGGLTPAQMGLHQSVNMANQSQVVTTTITLPNIVSGLQFRIFDVDYGAGQFADRIRATGTLNGSPTTPILTNGTANYVIGNQAFGDIATGDTSGAANIWVSFTSPVDTITIEYGNYSAAPANPGQQYIAIHDITFCTPHAQLSVAKTSTLVSDPIRGTTNPLAIPGASLTYCVLISNAGPSNASVINGIDLLPASSTFLPGSMVSGTSCGGAATAEDDNASGADESDPMGASVSGSTLTITAAALDSGNSIALVYNATIN